MLMNISLTEKTNAVNGNGFGWLKRKYYAKEYSKSRYYSKVHAGKASLNPVSGKQPNTQ